MFTSLHGQGRRVRSVVRAQRQFSTLDAGCGRHGRTVARRAERALVALGQAEALREAPRQYLNRLSDLLFVLARVLNRMHGGDDVYWKSERLARG